MCRLIEPLTTMTKVPAHIRVCVCERESERERERPMQYNIIKDVLAPLICHNKQVTTNH